MHNKQNSSVLWWKLTLFIESLISFLGVGLAEPFSPMFGQSYTHTLYMYTSRQVWIMRYKLSQLYNNYATYMYVLSWSCNNIGLLLSLPSPVCLAPSVWPVFQQFPCISLSQSRLLTPQQELGTSTDEGCHYKIIHAHEFIVKLSGSQTSHCTVGSSWRQPPRWAVFAWPILTPFTYSFSSSGINLKYLYLRCWERVQTHAGILVSSESPQQSNHSVSCANHSNLQHLLFNLFPLEKQLVWVITKNGWVASGLPKILQTDRCSLDKFNTVHTLHYSLNVHTKLIRESRIICHTSQVDMKSFRFKSPARSQSTFKCFWTTSI